MVLSFNKYIPSLPGKKYAYDCICEPEHVCTDEIFLQNEHSASEIPTNPVTVPLCVLGDVQLRFLCPDDLEEVRTLCQEWFPIGERKKESFFWKQRPQKKNWVTFKYIMPVNISL